MTSSTTYFENNQGSTYTTLGSSPGLLKTLFSWLETKSETLRELHIALYLFNNARLYDFLCSKRFRSTRIVVYSIPLEGYDPQNPVTIEDYDTKTPIGRFSKYDLAASLYERIKSAPTNIEMRIVPHMYLRSSRVRAFSRGRMPYSLHCKSFFAVCANGENYIGLASTNFAVRDAGKMELLSIISLSERMQISARDFYHGLYVNSIALNDFDDQENWSNYQIQMRDQPAKSQIMFIAPFYLNSASDFEENLKTMIRKAQDRIVICAQHVSSFEYSYNGLYAGDNAARSTIKKDGFLKDVLEKSREGVKTTVISQTYVDASNTKRCRQPQNKKSFVAFTEAAKSAGIHYFVNENMHCKYLIIDDIAVITTCNLTPTQFIYLPNVAIKHFENIPEASYSGIFCEIGAYYAARDQQMVNELEKITRLIIEDQQTKKMF